MRWLQPWRTSVGHELLICYLMGPSILLVFVTMGLSGSNSGNSCSGRSFGPCPWMPWDPRKSKTQVSLSILYLHHLSKHLVPTSYFVEHSEILVIVSCNWLKQRWRDLGYCFICLVPGDVKSPLVPVTCSYLNNRFPGVVWCLYGGGHAALWVEDGESGRDGQREVLGEFLVV